MYSCVYSWVKSVLRLSIERPILKLAFACVGNTITVISIPGDWKIKQRLLPYAERGLQLLHLWREDKKDSNGLEIYGADFLMNLGVLYSDQGKLEEANSIFQRALIDYEKAFGRDYTSILTIINNLGNLYRDQGKLEKAESIYQRALIGYEKAFGRDYTFILNAVNNLGVLYRDLSKLEKAKSIL